MRARYQPAVGSARARRRLRMICPAYPAFNIYSRPTRVMTALGPVCIATAVQDVGGWDAEVIDENNFRRGPRDAAGKPDHLILQRARPADIVGLYGGLTSTIPRLLELARLYQSLGAMTIAGGAHFADDNIEQALRSGVDIVVLGEGEKTITEVLAWFDRGLGGVTSGGLASGGGGLEGIPGVAFLKGGQVVRTAAREPITAFDELPIPDFSVVRHARIKYYPVSGVRGCGMNCEFCAVKGKPRFASPQRMMEQFATIYEKWGGKTFFIVDDLFGQNRRDALRLCRMLRLYQRRRRVHFSIMVQIRLDRARDTELLAAMRRAGISKVAIGFESPIAEELAAMDKRLRPPQMVELARTYRRFGFRTHGMFIFGYPGVDGEPFRMAAEERVVHFRRFIRRARLDTVQVMLPIPLPGTRLTERLRQAGRIFPTQVVGLEYYDGNFPLFEPDAPLTPQDLLTGAQKIMRGFYGPRHLLLVAASILAFPGIILWLHRVRYGWQRWYRHWCDSVLRSGGWLLLRKWVADFKSGDFPRKLAEARRESVWPGGVRT